MSSDPKELLRKGLEGEVSSRIMPEGGTDAPGGFTAVFAALGGTGASTAKAAAAPEDDDFARLFQTGTPTPAKAAADAAQAPSTGATASQTSFARPEASVFAPLETATSVNVSVQYARTTDDATFIFEALPKSVAPPSGPPSRVVPPSQESPRTALAAVTGASPVFAEHFLAEGAHTVSPVAPPDAPFTPRPAAAPAKPQSPESLSDFTQVFTPLAPPAMPVPPSRPVTAQSPAAGGEFTQFFSALSAREQAAEATPAQSGPTSMPPTSPPPQPAALTPVMANRTPVPPGPVASPSHQSTGDFTQIFQAADPLLLKNVALPQTMAEVPVRPTPPVRSEPSFTQVFQQIQPPSPAMQQPIRPVVGVTPPAPAAIPAQAPGAFREEGGWPAFGAPAQVHGSFTDVFAAQPASAVPIPRAATPAPPAAADGFTSLFQSPVQPTGAAGSPFNAFGGSPASPPPITGSAPAAGNWPVSPAAAQTGPLVDGGGEFTKLMQSLGSAAQGQFAGEAASPSVAGGSFFAAPVASSPGGGESEYTRVLRGSSQRESVAPAPLSAPVAANGSAPGVALDSPRKLDGEKKAEPKKSKALVILLIVMNVLLVIALIVIGVVVLRRH